MRIIGLAGKARSGKDTTGKLIEDWCVEHNLVSGAISLAAPLKQSAAAALGFEGSPEECVAFCDELKTAGVLTLETAEAVYPRKVTGREFLQLYGTEAHRDLFGEDFWTNLAQDKLRGMYRGGVHVAVITDCRFPNEGEMVFEAAGWQQGCTGLVWELQRAGADMQGGLEGHSSEAGMPVDLIDSVIHNDGDLTDLKHMVNSLCDMNLKGAI